MAPIIEFVELGPIRAVPLVWRPYGTSAAVTVICKATYRVEAGTATLAVSQDGINERDLHRENNPRLGLHSASDLYPFKPRADVLVVGKVFAPPRQLARSLVARLQIGSVDKMVEVHADRFLEPDGRIEDNKFFSKMSIGYEFAPGGPGTFNPVGRALVKPAAGGARTQLPNLQHPGERLDVERGALTPVGFGPIPKAWPSRQEMANRTPDAWLEGRWFDAPAPASYDWSFFNVAPPDQQLDALTSDAALVLHHLHPEEAVLETRLCGVQPCVFVQRGGQPQPLVVKPDTLWIDTNRLVMTLTWRGTLSLDQVDERLRIVVATVEAGDTLNWQQACEQVKAHGERQAVESEPPPHNEAGVTLCESPTSLRSNDLEPQSTPSEAGSGRTAPVPMVPSADHAPGWLPPPSSPDSLSPGDSELSETPLVIELALQEREVSMLRTLCKASGSDGTEMLRRLIREAHSRGSEET